MSLNLLQHSAVISISISKHIYSMMRSDSMRRNDQCLCDLRVCVCKRGIRVRNITCVEAEHKEEQCL